MKLVVGGTGLLGGMIVRRLVDDGKRVCRLVRSESPEVVGTEWIRGDLKDRASLDAACAGVDTVITTANSAQRGGADNVESVDVAGNLSLIDAAARAGVRHFIFVSAATADESSPVPLFAAKARTEGHLRASGMTWTILAPHVFMDVWFPMIIGSAIAAGKPIALVAGGKRRHSFIAVRDVAAFAAASVDNDASANRRLFLGGPEGISWTDVVAMTGDLIGRAPEVEVIAPGAAIPTLPAPVGQIIGELAAGLEQQDVVFDTTALAREFGVTLTPAETLLRELLATPA
jgi:NADH dehydrogenase